MSKEIVIEGFYFSKDDNKEFAEFCAKAYEKGRWIEVTYNEGYMSYEGHFDEKTNSRKFKIGKSSGDKKILLEINSEHSMGGSALFASKDAIKSWRYINYTGKILEVDEILEKSLKDIIMDSYIEEDGAYCFNEELFMKKINMAKEVLV